MAVDVIAEPLRGLLGRGAWWCLPDMVAAGVEVDDLLVGVEGGGGQRHQDSVMVMFRGRVAAVAVFSRPAPDREPSADARKPVSE